MSTNHEYTEQEDGAAGPSHVEAWVREHNTGEQTIVTVRLLADVHVVEAMDIDENREYPSVKVGVTNTADEAVHVAEQWMADHGTGVSPGGLMAGFTNAGGDIL